MHHNNRFKTQIQKSHTFLPVEPSTSFCILDEPVQKSYAVSNGFVHSFFCNSLIKVGAVCKSRTVCVCVFVKMGRNTWFPLQRNLNEEVQRLSGHSDLMLVPVFTNHHTLILLQGKVFNCMSPIS